MFKSFKEMPAWNDAMDLAEEIFRLSEHFPKKEDYGLTSQLRRAALSISANIAEAYGRNHTLDKINFYYTQNRVIFGFTMIFLSCFRGED